MIQLNFLKLRILQPLAQMIFPPNLDNVQRKEQKVQECDPASSAGAGCHALSTDAIKTEL
jgi:hypothetical protein